MNPRSLGVFSALALMVQTAVGDGWERVASLPEPIGGFLGGTVDGDIVVAGGTNWKDDTKRWLDAIWRLDQGTNTWKPAGRLPFPLAYAAMGQAPKGIAFAGGGDGQSVHREIFQLDESLRIARSGILPKATIYAGATVVDGHLYILGGGTDAVDLSTWGPQFIAVELQSGAAKTLPAFPAGPVSHPAVVPVGERIFVFTGASFHAARDEVVNHDFAFQYSIRDQTWKPLRAFPFAVRGLAAMKLDERHILLGGGYKNDREEFTTDAYLYDVNTDTYVRTVAFPFAAMAPLVAKAGDFLYLIGGEDRKKHRTDAAFRIRWRELLPESR